VDGEEGVGVAVVVACGVAEVFIAGVGDGERPGIVSTWPSESELGSAMLLERTISSTVTPNISAMPERVSPALTLYVMGGTVGKACGVGVGDGTGVTTSLIGSPEPPAPPHAASKRSTASERHPAAISRIRCEAGLVGRNNAMMTYGFLDVMPVLGMVGTSDPWPSIWSGDSCVPVLWPASAPVGGAPGAEDWLDDPFGLGR
jgi:hypothetical protein